MLFYPIKCLKSIPVTVNRDECIVLIQIASSIGVGCFKLTYHSIAMNVLVSMNKHKMQKLTGRPKPKSH